MHCVERPTRRTDPGGRRTRDVTVRPPVAPASPPESLRMRSHRLSPGLLLLLGCAASKPVPPPAATPVSPVAPAVARAAPEPALGPPTARVEHTVVQQSGDARVDDYAWLRKKKDPEVEKYLQ
ncbi:MAG: hypothetical protein ACXWLF_03360, partial [Myxococcaceae bacterium]